MASASTPRILAPVAALTDRLRTSARLAVLVAVLLVPGTVATWAYLDTSGAQVDFSDKERTGVEVLRPALTALAGTATGRTPDLTAMTTAAAAHPELELADAVRAVEQATPGTSTLTAEERVAAAESLVVLITKIGDDSNLILDPDLDSFSVIDIHVVQLPKLLLAAAHAGLPPTTGDERSRLAGRAVTAGAVSAASAAIESDIATAVESTSAAGLAARLVAVGKVAEAGKALATQLTDTLDRPAQADPGQTGTADPGRLGTAAGQAVADSVTGLDDLLVTRIDELSANRTLTLTVTLTGLALACWLAAAVWWRNRHDVSLAVGAVTAIAAGDLAEHPLPQGRDELGDIGRAVAGARRQLAGQDANLRRAADESEAQLRASFQQQQKAEAQSRARAQALVDESSATVLSELAKVVVQVEVVRGTAGTVDAQVGAADAVTRTVVEHTSDAQQVLGQLERSLRLVAGTAKLIAGVADQTKLLALNATIEAARAGEAGKGFSVVANEVKELATATAHSTEQISTTIASLESDATAMTAAIVQVAGGINAMNEATNGLRGIAAEQHRLVGDLDQSVNEAIDRVRTMADMTGRLERRYAARVAATGPARLRIGSRLVVVQLVDLSTGGTRCVLEQPEEILVGQPLVVELDLDGPCSAPGRVTYRDAGGTVGIQFDPGDTAVSERVERYLARMAGT